MPTTKYRRTMTNLRLSDKLPALKILSGRVATVLAAYLFGGWQGAGLEY